MAKKTDPALDEADVGADAGTDELGLTSAVAADDPVRTGVPRDETHDSIDRHTGTLTEDAVAKRAERAAGED